jgi:cell wall-associated NlpC family hydrolase
MSTLPDIKASDFIRQLRTHNGQGYVYGMRGKDSPCTVAILKSKEAQYGKKMGPGYYQLNGDYTKGKCARWLGKPATDCSGLVRWVYWELLDHKYDFSKSADGMYQWCSKRGAISGMPKQAGVLVFKVSSGAAYHVGVYTGGGKVIQAGGVEYGIKEEPMKSGWTHWGLWDLLDMDVPADGTAAPEPPAPEPQEPETPAETAPVYFTTTATLYHLWNIGKAFNIPWTSIRKADGSIPNPLAMRAGIKLIVGYKIAEQPVYFTTTKDLYRLWDIGRHFGVPWETIRYADGSAPDPLKMKIGQKLRIK